jgi:hypothetical protein
MLFLEIKVVHSANHTTPTDILCEQNAELLSAKAAATYILSPLDLTWLNILF